MKEHKRVAVFCRYGENGASSRVRFFRYRPFFEKAGVEVEFHSFFDNAYLERLYAGHGRTLSAIPKGVLRRINEIRNIPADVPFFIEYELFPMLWAWCDLAALKKRTLQL